MENNKEYEEARKKAAAASSTFRLAAEAYRARLTDDATFLAAKAEYAKAEAEFDAAYAAAQGVN